jgi:hypothetical protein
MLWDRARVNANRVGMSKYDLIKMSMCWKTQISCDLKIDVNLSLRHYNKSKKTWVIQHILFWLF